MTKTELKSIFDDHAIKIINYFIKKSVFSQPERRLNQDCLAFQISKEHIEQRMTQALNAKSTGAWSYPVDLISWDLSWWADVKMLSCKADKHWNLTMKDSWETSLWQNFKWAWNQLDWLFEKWAYKEIMNMRTNLIKEKLLKPQKQHGIKKIYYFILLRCWSVLYLLWLNVNTNALGDITVNQERSSKNSVYINNYIQWELWNVKIYKAKKRMELRLHPKTRQDKWYLIPFELNINDEPINFREYVENWNDILEHGIEKAKNIFN